MKLRKDYLYIILLPLATVVSFIFFTGLSSAHSYGRKGLSCDDKTCTNAACRIAAKDLKTCMDTTVNPCDDFYKFTCGNFLKEAKIPEDKESITTFSEADDKLNKKLRAIFEMKDCNDCPHYEIYLKDYYKSCMNTSIIKKDGEKSMLEMFSEFGGWPLIDDSWDDSKSDLTHIMTTMLKYGLMNLFSVFVHNDEKNSSVHTIIMYQKTLTFPIDYYFDEKHKDKLDAFKTFITNVAMALSKAKQDEINQNVEDIIEFDKCVSEIMYPPEKERGLNQEPITLSSLADKFKEVVNMTAIVEKLFGEVGIKIDQDESIGIYGVEYFDKLAKLLKETSKRTVINYLTWKMFEKLLITLPQKYQNYSTEFEKVESGVSKVKPHWNRCTSLVTSYLYKPLGAVYAKTYFNKTAKDKIKELIEELKISFKGMILNVPWLTNDTRSLALNKLSKIRELIGYPDYYDTEKDLFEDLFDKIKNDDPESKSFLRKHLDFLAIVANENFKLLRKAVDLDKPDMEVAVINAFYNPLTNTIIFPAGILQWPFFSEDVPMYINYGRIGSVIGHEITHGFDDEGHKFDETGSLHNWWKEEDKTKFVDASKCVAEMYSNFVVEDLNENMNGNQTLGESIADNGGVRAAFMAYKIWKHENGEEPKLPDLDYTSEQLFFINFGRAFCEKTRPEAAAKRIRNNYHPPGHFRIIGSLMNMEEFSEVFRCQPKSRMNPETRCRVW